MGGEAVQAASSAQTVPGAREGLCAPLGCQSTGIGTMPFFHRDQLVWREQQGAVRDHAVTMWDLVVLPPLPKVPGGGWVRVLCAA